MSGNCPEIVWPEGIKKTKQRKAVLEILMQAPLPLTAMEIAAKLEHKGEGVWLSTVYRVLEIFVDHDLVHKTPILDSGISIYELARHTHRHYAVCIGCNHVIAIENCPLDSFLPRMAEEGFCVTGHQLQMYGYCGQCASGSAPTVAQRRTDTI